MNRPTPKPRRADASHAAPPGFEAPPWAARIVAGIVALLLLLAPPAHNAFWAVNGLRSVAPGMALALVGVSALAVFAARRPPSGRTAAVLAVLLALALAFPLAERLHFLGDTGTRLGAIVDAAAGHARLSFAEWSRTLHAQPLDVVFGLELPAAICRATERIDVAAGAVSVLLALAYFLGTWRLARRLAAAPATAGALWLALAASGALQAYAGYAESAGLVLAAAAWWWSAMLAPLARRRDGFALVAAWLVLAGAHRLGLVMLVPQLVRTLGPALHGDLAAPRRWAAMGSLAAGAAAVAAMAATGSGQAALDLAELARWPEADALRSVPTDLANLALLLAPLLLLALPLAGREAWRSLARDPRALSPLVAAVLLLPTAFPIPVAPSGLGVQRDWDLALLLGFALTLLGALALVRLRADRLLNALALALPLLACVGGGFVAVNADARAADARALALVSGPLGLGGQHASAALFNQGQRALGQGRAAEAAPLLERSWALVPTPARGIAAAYAWYDAGDHAAAARVLAVVRARGGLSPGFAADADSLAAHLEPTATPRHGTQSQRLQRR